MKIKDILSESSAPLVAQYHRGVDEDFDSYFNPQAAMIAELNREHYKKYFSDFDLTGIVPVFEKDDGFHDPEAESWDNKPIEGDPQSAGYRGQQNALHRAGLPHDENVQRYNVRAFNYDLSYDLNSSG
jgi:hypothetical protein